MRYVRYVPHPFDSATTELQRQRYLGKVGTILKRGVDPTIWQVAFDDEPYMSSGFTEAELELIATATWVAGWYHDTADTEDHQTGVYEHVRDWLAGEAERFTGQAATRRDEVELRRACSDIRRWRGGKNSAVGGTYRFFIEPAETT